MSLPKAILVLGLAAISVYTHIRTDGDAGEGWGFLAVLVLFLAE